VTVTDIKTENEVIIIPTYIKSMPVIKLCGELIATYEKGKDIVGDPYKALYIFPKYFYIPEFVKSICPKTFIYSDEEDIDIFNCNFKYIIVDEKNSDFSSVDGIMYNADKTRLITYPFGKKEKVFIIPDKTKSLYDKCFFSSAHLESLVLHKDLSFIGKDVFLNCLNLREFLVDKSNPWFKSVEGVLYNKEMTTLIAYPSNKHNETFNIPIKVNKIVKNAFYKTRNLRKVFIHNTQEFNEKNVFVFCKDLVIENIKSN
jgi:hypothetical protein